MIALYNASNITPKRLRKINTLPTARILYPPFSS
jgi:hypothetical protein